MPYERCTAHPNFSFVSRISSGDTSAAPEPLDRTLRILAGEKFRAASIPWMTAGGPPAPVTPWRSTRSTASSGSKLSMKTTLDPCAIGSITNITIPPRCASGNWSRPTSSGVGWKSSAWKRITAPSVDGVWITPLGSAVVPEV